MKKPIILLLLSILGVFSFSQNDMVHFDKKAKDRFVIWLIPSAARNIYGIAIGPVGSEAICNRPYTKYSHGLNLQVPGQGFFQAFYMNKVKYKNLEQTIHADSVVNSDSASFSFSSRAVHNGIIVSPLGTFTPKVNGLSLSLFMSMGHKINGLSMNLFWNVYTEINGVSIGLVNTTGTMKGIQAGLVNKSVNLRGIQIGIWNKNEKRSLPLINWDFNRKKS